VATPGRRWRMAAIAVAGFITIAGTAGPAHAQSVRSETRGLLLGAHLSSTSLEIEDGDRETGGGGGLMIGYGVSRRVAIYLGVTGTRVRVSNPDIGDEYTLGQADLGVRVSFRGPEDRFIPYFVAAVTGMSAKADIPIGNGATVEGEMRGGGLTLGGGFSHYFNPSLALDVSLLLTGGRFTELRFGPISAEIPDELEANAGRLTIGLNWSPGGSR